MKFPLVLSLIIIGTLLNTSAKAQNYPWCAIYNDGSGSKNCGFASFQQSAHKTVHISLSRDRPDGAILIERAFAELTRGAWRCSPASSLVNSLFAAA
jgi:hypothetical protein